MKPDDPNKYKEEEEEKKIVNEANTVLKFH
jgi:hypothetical protein